MAYLEIIKRNESTYAEGAVAHSVLVALSPENVRGVEDDTPIPNGGLGYWDWVAGYGVIRTSQGRHDGQPATLMVIGDSDGQREIGRIVIRNDALRGDRLEVVRQFDSDEQRDAWVAAQTEAPGTDEVKSIQLDITDEGWTEEELGGDSENFPLNVLMAMTAGTTISYRIVQLRGPGGGWPVIEFTGKDRELRKMLVDHYGAGDGSGEPVSFYMGD